MNDLERAVLSVSGGGFNPPAIWYVPSSASVELGAGRNPFDGLSVTAWAQAR